MKRAKRSSSIVVLAAVCVSFLPLVGCVGGESSKPASAANASNGNSDSMDSMNSDSSDSMSTEAAPELPSKGVTWINTKPLSLKKLRGQVVLVDFWEYTCINCIRSFPFEKQLYKRYHDDGLEILGIHDPEFDIAYKTANVRRAVKRFKLPWPVAADPKFAIWNAFNSHTWPNYFLIDQQGNLVKHWSGEGHDAAIERKIQTLLAKDDPNFDPSKYKVEQKNWFSRACGDMTGETYVGRWHGRGALQGQGGYQNGVRPFNADQTPDDGHFVLAGKWQTSQNGSTYRGQRQSAPAKSGRDNQANANGNANGNGNGNANRNRNADALTKSNQPHLTLKYHAREIYSVMNTAHAQAKGQAGGKAGTNSKAKAKAIKLYVTQDGQYLSKKNAAADTQFDKQGRSYITVHDPRMYYVVLNAKGDDGEHILRLWPTKPGLTVNSFTFGNNCAIDFAHLYSHQGPSK